MDDLQIKMSFSEELVNLEFDKIPAIVAKFIISHYKKIPNSLDEFEPIKLFYSDDTDGIKKLLYDLKEYMEELNINNINEHILSVYLGEIYDMIEPIKDKQKSLKLN